MISISEEATRRRLEKQNREQIEAIRKQLETSENRLRETLILKKSLYQDYETQSKELKLLQRKNNDLIEENKKLVSKIESLTRISNGPTALYDNDNHISTNVATLTK